MLDALEPERWGVEIAVCSSEEQVGVVPSIEDEIEGAAASPYAEAAAGYRPTITRLLFVAEAPPATVERYFYFPDVPRHDSLWVELMRALYGNEFRRARDERPRKPEWLRRFAGDGYQLIDAVKEPIAAGVPSKRRIKIIGERAAENVAEIRQIAPEQVVLVKQTVYEGLRVALRDAGIHVANTAALPFPGSGQQRRFQDGFRSLVATGRLTL